MTRHRPPILRDVPVRIDTARLTLRPPVAGDGAAVNAAIVESFARLERWMEWARKVPAVADSEVFCREHQARFVRREELTFLILRTSDGLLLGATGLHHIDWEVGAFETGYWIRTSAEGQGYVSEALAAIVDLTFSTLGGARLEIRCDERNHRSRRVAERLGFTFEGTLRAHARSNAGGLRNTCVYAMVPGTVPSVT